MYFLMVFLYIYLYFYVLVRAPNCTPLAVFHCAGIFAQIVQIAWPCILYLHFYVSVFYYVCYESMLCYTINLWVCTIYKDDDRNTILDVMCYPSDTRLTLCHNHLLSMNYDVKKMDETVA